jgi:hypothetical protein
MMKVINVAVTADGCVTDTGTSAKDVWRKTICQLLRKKANGCPSARIFILASLKGCRKAKHHSRMTIPHRRQIRNQGSPIFSCGVLHKGEYLDPKTHMIMLELESRQKQNEWNGSKRLSYRSSYRGNTSSGRRCNIIILAAVVKELRIQDIMVSRNFICERCRKAI